MRSRVLAFAATCIWLAACAPATASSVTAGNSAGGPRQVAPLNGASTLTEAVQLELAALPAAELRRRLDAVIAAHPEDVVARLLRAGAENELGDGSAALRDLEPVIAAATPDNRAFVFSVRSEALMQIGRFEEALADGERAVAADANDPQALFARGWAMHLSRKSETQALRDIEAGMAKEPDDAVALSRRGVLFLALDDPQRALPDLQRAMTLAPRNASIRVDLAAALMAQGQVDAARAQLDEAVRFAPETAIAWSMRAQLELSLGHADAAIADASRALELPDDTGSLSASWLSRATAWGMKGDYAKMLADLDKGSAIDPARAEFPALRGAYEMETGQLAAAKATLTHALAIDPACVTCLAERALAEARLDDRDAALADARAAMKPAPGTPAPHPLIGNVLAQLGEFPDAIKEFDAALIIDPTNEAIWIARAEAQEELKNHAAAIEGYTHVLERGQSPHSGEVLNSRGIAWYHAGDLAHAIADFRRAAALLPKDAEPLRFLGRALEDSDDLAGAAAAYSQSLALETDGMTAGSLGRMQRFSGHFADAVEPYRTFVRVGKTSQAYAVLWLYLSRIRASAADEGSARTELASLAPPHDPRVWTDSLTDFMLGRIDATTLQQRADDGLVEKRTGYHCEADYYIAEVELAHGRRAIALPLLDEAARICPPTFHEANAAKAERKLQDVAATTK
jgi:tetratricopeptide (TPR) repeat protein